MSTSTIILIIVRIYNIILIILASKLPIKDGKQIFDKTISNTGESLIMYMHRYCIQSCYNYIY